MGCETETAGQHAPARHRDPVRRQGHPHLRHGRRERSRFVFNTINPGQATIFPKGSVHYQANEGCEPMTFVCESRSPLCSAPSID